MKYSMPNFPPLAESLKGQYLIVMIQYLLHTAQVSREENVSHNPYTLYMNNKMLHRTIFSTLRTAAYTNKMGCYYFHLSFLLNLLQLYNGHKCIF
jgi:hypothetical protein